MLSQSYPDGDSVGSLNYDAAGRLKTVPGILTNILYDAAGHQTNVTRQNGASTTMTWSAQRGWLNSLLTSSTAGVIQDYSYTRDDLGRITAVASSQAGEGWIYGYDDLDRLLSADNTTDNTRDQTFTYDLVGNMLTNSKVGTYGYPAQGPGSVRPHAVSGVSGGPWGTQSFTYDANGSMTNEGADTRTYDGENRLIGAVDGTDNTSFVYGPDGARLKKTTNGTVTLYLGEDVEKTGSQYLKYLPGDAKKTGSGGSGTLYWMHRDHLQSVRAVSKANGTIDDSSAYRAFGEQLGFAGATPQTKGYIGERLDDKTGLLYLHARYYDPALGRFLQADPMGPTGAGVGMNRYAYAGNNPILLVDPSGLSYGDFAERTGQGAFGNGAHGHEVAGRNDGNDSAHGGPFFAAYTWNGTQIGGAVFNVDGSLRGFLNQGNLYTPAGVRTGVRLADDGWHILAGATGAWMAMTGQINLAAAAGPVRPAPSPPPHRGPYSPNLPGWHNYFAGPNMVCDASCTLEEMADQMSRFGVPGQNPAIPVVNGQISPVYDPFTGYYAGDVVTTISSDGLTITNTTLPGHVFYDGEIVRTATRNPDGSWSVTTHGFGNDVEFGMGEVNQLLRPEVFNKMDEQMKENIELHHNANW